MSRPCPALAAPRNAGRRAGAAGPAEDPLTEDLLAFLASEEFAAKMGLGDTRRQSAVEPAAPGARAAQGGRQRARRGRGRPGG